MKNYIISALSVVVAMATCGCQLFVTAPGSAVPAALVAVITIAQQGEACNRYYTSTDQGKDLTRLNRRNGITKVVGRWQFIAPNGPRIINSLEWVSACGDSIEMVFSLFSFSCIFLPFYSSLFIPRTSSISRCGAWRKTQLNRLERNAWFELIDRNPAAPT